MEAPVLAQEETYAGEASVLQGAWSYKEANPAGEVVLETHEVNVYYGDNHALHGTSLTFHKNEITALIGPSGCGKSTLLKTLNRMNDLVEGCRVEGRSSLTARMRTRTST